MLAPRHCWGGHSAAAAIHSVACLWHCGWGSSCSVQASAAGLLHTLRCAGPCWAVCLNVLGCAGPAPQHSQVVLQLSPLPAQKPLAAFPKSLSCPMRTMQDLRHVLAGFLLQVCTCRSVLCCAGIGRSTPNLTCSCPRCQHDESLRVLLHPLPPAGPQARPSMSAHLDLACALYLRAAGSSSSAIW